MYQKLSVDRNHNVVPQDQTVKVAEARELESELQRMKEENADLRKRLSETSALEAAKKKAEARAEQLEQKVCTLTSHFGARLNMLGMLLLADGRYDSGESHAERKRT